MRRIARHLCAALLCAWLYAVGLAAGVAPAANQFGAYGKTAGKFIEPNGIAADGRTGAIYIVDSDNKRVDKFASDGRFLLAWGWGVLDGKTRALQVCTTATNCHAGLNGLATGQDECELDGPGQFGFAEGVAVDNDPGSPSRGDVYVVDLNHHRVEKFSPAGRFLLMFGRAVNATARKRRDAANEDVCPVDPGDRCKAGIRGSAAGQFEFPVEGNFIAVGPTAMVYVGDRNRVQEFSPTGISQLQLVLRPRPRGEAETGGTSRLAVDSSGDLYVVRIGARGVAEYTPQGELLQTIDEEGVPENNEGPTPGLALDSAGHVFVDYNERGQHRLVEYDSLGVELATFDAGMEGGPHGLAYDDATGKLYVVSTNSNVTPPVAHVRILAPPRLTHSVLSSFDPLMWLLAP
jgi:tripartite motif-containing protein 71